MQPFGFNVKLTKKARNSIIAISNSERLKCLKEIIRRNEQSGEETVKFFADYSLDERTGQVRFGGGLFSSVLRNWDIGSRVIEMSKKN